MNKIRSCGKVIRHFHGVNDRKVTVTPFRYFETYSNRRTESKTENTENSAKEAVNSEKLSGFIRSFENFSKISKSISDDKTFASLLRNSKFIDLGDPEGKIVIGKVVHIVEEDVHIDFGWKFNCVCPLPVKDKSFYRRGSLVYIKIKTLELSTRFLGATKDFTVLEAKCFLKGLVHLPTSSTTRKEPSKKLIPPLNQQNVHESVEEM